MRTIRYEQHPARKAAKQPDRHGKRQGTESNYAKPQQRRNKQAKLRRYKQTQYARKFGRN